MNPQEEEFKGRAELERYIERLKADGRSKHTIRNFYCRIRQVLQWINKYPNEICFEDVENYRYRCLVGKGLSANAQASVLIAIRLFLKFVGKEDMAARIRLPRRPKSLPRFLTEDEMAKLLLAAKTDPMAYALIAVTYYGGLRKHDVVNLNISDINFEDCTIRINRGKGNKDAIVVVHRDAIEAVKSYLPHRLTPNDKSDALFVSNRRKRINEDLPHDMVRRYAAKAGITRRVYPHMLRHTLAATMWRHGANLLDIQAQLRHEDIKTTTIYTHIENEAMKKRYQSVVPSLLTRAIQEKTTPAKPLIEKPRTLEEKIQLLEDRFLAGEISEELYRELKNKYELAKTAAAQEEKRAKEPVVGYA